MKRVSMAYKEAFISLVPYLFTSSCCLLLAQAWDPLGFSLLFFGAQSVQLVASVLIDFFPVALMFAIALRLARRFEVNYILTVLCSVTVLLTVSIINSKELHHLFGMPGNTFLVLIIPPMVVLLFNVWGRRSEAVRSSSGDIKVTLQSLIPFVLISILLVLACMIILWLTGWVLEIIKENLPALDKRAIFYIRLIIEHMLWFFGIHGSNVLYVAENGEILDFYSSYGLSHKEILDVFVIFGGSGATLGLVFVLLWFSRDRHMRRTAQLALPFSLFNINELVIYGLPIIFNRYLLLPFIGVPLINSFIAFNALPLMQLEPNSIQIPWTTPVFLNSYILYGGDWKPLLLQLVLLVLDALIYLPFARHYSQLQSVSYQTTRLGSNLGISEPLATRENLASFQAEQSIIHANEEVSRTVRMLENSEMLVYYQPVVDIELGACRRYEALLRLKKEDGSIVGPYFLEQLEQAGMAPLIDLWVSRQVKEDLMRWREQDFTPCINVNLNPDTLGLPNVVEEITQIFQGETVAFEVIERGLNRTGYARDAINRFKQNNFKISIDDFGSGYSSFEELCHVPFSSLKLDKSLIDLLGEEKGRAIIHQIAALCRELKIDCVAEGVEQAWQVDALRASGLRLIQGFYFSQALPFEEVVGFEPNVDRQGIKN